MYINKNIYYQRYVSREVYVTPTVRQGEPRWEGTVKGGNPRVPSDWQIIGTEPSKDCDELRGGRKSEQDLLNRIESKNKKIQYKDILGMSHRSRGKGEPSSL